MTPKAGMPSLEAGAEPERILDRLEAPMEALHARWASSRFEAWRHDLRETRETWFRLADTGGQGPTPEGS